MRINKGEINTLAISMPPRAGKSYITSLFCAWWLANNFELCVMRNTVTSSLYRKFSYDIRDIIKSNKFQEVFPNIELQPDKQNIDGWSLTSSKQGAYFGGGVGTNIIGFGANLAITDDLYSGFGQAMSEVYGETVHQWKQGSHNSRMEKHCPEIYIGTRWSKTDVIGRAVEENKIDCNIVIQALTADDKSFCEHVKTTNEYLKLRMETESSIWDAEYQQQPAEIKGRLFLKEDLKRFKLPDLPNQTDGILSYCDVADEGDDYFCQVMASLHEGKVYIPKVIFTQDNVDITSKKCCDMINRFTPEFTWIESNGQGSIFLKMIRNMVAEPENVLPHRVTANKITRIMLSYGYIKKYFVFLDEDQYKPGSEYDKFVKNILSFMKDGSSKHDDAPDCISGLLKQMQIYLPDFFEQYTEPVE